MELKRGRELHGLALQAQEKGDFLEALKLEVEAEITYQADADQKGFAEIQAMQALTYKHLHEKTGFKGYLVKRKYLAMASVELAETSGIKEALAVPLFNLAKALEDLGQLDKAVETFRRAVVEITTNPPTTHARPAVVADFKGYLATCEYRAGDKTARERIEAAIKELEDSPEEDGYSKSVWLSGAHMRTAEVLAGDDSVKAKEHLDKAKAIIDANPDLKLRAEQWQKLAEKLSL